MIKMAYKMRNGLHLLQNVTALMTICLSFHEMPQPLLKKCFVILLLRTVRGLKTSTTPISYKSY